MPRDGGQCPCTSETADQIYSQKVVGKGEDPEQRSLQPAQSLPAKAPSIVTLLGERGAEVRIEVFGREHPGYDDYWDGNWLMSRVGVHAGGFRGQFRPSLRAEDFVRFRDGVRVCMTDLRGAFVFETMEEQLSIIARGDGLGHFRAECRAQDEAGTGNELTFTIDLDQTYLAPLALQLDNLLKAYPVVGHRNK